MDSPPVSKVMPLPTRTTAAPGGRPGWSAAGRAARRGRVVEPDQPRRRRRRPADRQQAAHPRLASSFSSQTDTSRPESAATSRACSASHSGFLRLDGTVASVRERQDAPPMAMARRRTPSSSPASAWPASTIRATGVCSGPVERQWKPKEPSIAPIDEGLEPVGSAIAAIELATASTSRVARASAAPARLKAGGALVADTDQQHPAYGRVTAHGERGHLPGLAGRVGAGPGERVEEVEQVDPEALGRLVGAGPEQGRPIGTGERREGEHLDAADGIGEQRAQRELRRRDLGG